MEGNEQVGANVTVEDQTTDASEKLIWGKCTRCGNITSIGEKSGHCGRCSGELSGQYTG